MTDNSGKKRSINNWFVTKKYFAYINAELEKQGYHDTFIPVVQKLTYKTTYREQAETLETLAKEPVLLITNHPSELDLLLLLSRIPYRKDFYVLINRTLMSIITAFDPHCIPLYLTTRYDGAQKLGVTARLLKKLHDYPSVSAEESQAKNRESIQTAAQRISEGGLVLMAPGSRKKDQAFRAGLGFLLNGIENPQKAKIVMSRISGTTSRDLLRFFPLVKYIMPRVSLEFSAPVEASEFISGDAKKDTLKLQEFYFDWVKRISTPNVS